MALSGSFSGSIANGNYKLRVDWVATQNVTNNTSKITCTIYLVQASSWSLNISSRDDNKITIAGTEYTWTSPAISNSGGKTTKLATVTSGNISHDADGSKSVSIAATFNIKATISGTYRSSISASSTVTLNTIPRATQPSLSSSSVNMGSAVTISLPRASSSMTHNLSYRFNKGSWVAIATGVGTSRSWTVPDLASSIPNATSGQITIRAITVTGGKTIGTKYAYLTAKVPSSVVPPAPTVAVQEGTAGIAEQFGAYVQGKSKLVGSVAATGVKGSSIVAYQTTLLGKVYTGSSWTSDTLTAKGSISLVTKVKDSRGRWSAGKTTTINVLEYSTPKVTKLQAYRVDSAGAADEEGAYLRLDYAYSVAALGGKNTASAVVQYKRSVDSTWTTLATFTALSANTTYKPASPTFSIDYEYDIRLTVTDWFGAARTYTATLPSGAVIMDIKANGKGIAFGKTAEFDGVDLGWDWVGVNSMSSMAGQWKIPGGPLIQWGTTSITPSAANTPTKETVNFPRAYTSTPLVFLTAVSSAPEACSLGVVDRVAGSFGCVLTRTNTVATTINWLAIGQGG